MIFLHIIGFLLLTSFAIEGHIVKEVVYQRTDPNPLSQSMRMSWYRFSTKYGPQDPLEQSKQVEADQVLSNPEEGIEKEANGVDKILFGKGIYSQEKLFKSLVTGKGGQLCYGLCSGSSGFCNNGCKCNGGICQPTGPIDRSVFHYGGSRPISTNEEWIDNSLTASQSDYFLYKSDIGLNEKANAELPDCYWTGCVEFNHASCADGYKMMTKEKCGDWECKYVLNCQTKWCCKE